MASELIIFFCGLAGGFRFLPTISAQSGDPRLFISSFTVFHGFREA
jgi:hypothetical protein